ncbi:glycosyltransferase family 9 protein [Streptomyces marincola]|uniref:glycosyltransferase family 9 protein n=1 Tax=Streptomyces marincola TaxID=2878388 RepID=UPI001CF59D77|nr:glycosyltransferase family 9 protein [Streptomyces marincola]UCM86529.1 glycosyltransferase family 9 protein [Streptomyces marincola]
MPSKAPDAAPAAGGERRAARDARRAVLFAARSATALHRLLDVLPVFAGDERIDRAFTLVPGSDFGVDALAAVERAGARTTPWEEASRRAHDLVLMASPKGELALLRGRRVLLPHGAGFGKSVEGEGTPGTPSGLDPAFLVPDGDALLSLHALAHPSQVGRLAALSPHAAARAAVVGDPTLERVLASRGRREDYRAALGTGARHLIALASTWGPESLLRRRPALPTDLAARLPWDTYQLALILHPNERSRLGELNLAERLAPALDAGMFLAGPFEEWAAVLIACDAVITDHGSAALYAAALGRPVVSAYDGGGELVPGSPMADLLDRSPFLADADGLDAALGAQRPGAVRAPADGAFAERGRALERLRAELYRLLDVPPPRGQVVPRLLPEPAAPPRGVPASFAVRARVDGRTVTVERLPTGTDAPAHHLAAEAGRAPERHAMSAAVLYRRVPRGPDYPAAGHGAAWTVAGWTEETLADHPGCRTAGVVLSPDHCVARGRRGPLLSVRIEPLRRGGRVVRTDPAAVLSGVHAWLGEGVGNGAPPGSAHEVTCVVGGLPFAVRLRPASAAEAAREC